MAVVNEQPVCVICNTRPTWTSERYADGVFPAELSDHCFACAFWKRRAAEWDNRSICTESYSVFTLMNPLIDTERNKSLLGYGGHLWRIQYLDDNTIIETNNLWSGGVVPESHRHLFTPNVRIL